MHVNERNQNKSKVMSNSNLPRVLLFNLAHKQRNGIIKGWLHFLTSEAKGRLLVNNILLAWCLVMTQIQFSLMIKNKDWASRTLANPLLPTFDNILFLPDPRPHSPHLKVDVICVSPSQSIWKIPGSGTKFGQEKNWEKF